MTLDVRLLEVDALRLAPGEVLIVKLSMDDDDGTIACDIADALRDVGLGGRSLVIHSNGVELIVAKKEEPCGSTP